MQKTSVKSLSFVKLAMVALCSTAAASGLSCKPRTYNESGALSKKIDKRKATFSIAQTIQIKNTTAVCFYAATRSLDENQFDGKTIKPDLYDAIFADSVSHMSLVKPYKNPQSLQDGDIVNLDNISKINARRTPVENPRYVTLSALNDSLDRALGKKLTQRQQTFKVFRKFAGKTLNVLDTAGAAVLLAPYALGASTLFSVAAVMEARQGDMTTEDAKAEAVDSFKSVGKWYWEFSQGLGAGGEKFIDSLFEKDEYVSLAELTGLTDPKASTKDVGSFIQQINEKNAQEPLSDSWDNSDDHASPNDIAFKSRLAMQHLVSMAHESGSKGMPACPSKPEIASKK